MCLVVERLVVSHFCALTVMCYRRQVASRLMLCSYSTRNAQASLTGWFALLSCWTVWSGDARAGLYGVNGFVFLIALWDCSEGYLIGRVLDFLENDHTVCEVKPNANAPKSNSQITLWLFSPQSLGFQVNSMFPSDLGDDGAMQGGLVLVQVCAGASYCHCWLF